jgi:type I restriction enzyme S subunit
VDRFIYEGLHLLVAEDGENLRSRKTPIAFLADGKFWVNNHAHVLQANEDNDLRFLAYALEDSDISGFITGSTQPKLSQAALNEIPITAPDFFEQQTIATTLGALDDKIDSNRRVVTISSLLLDALAERVEEILPRVPLGSIVTLNKKIVNPATLTNKVVEYFNLPVFDECAVPERAAPATILSNKMIVGTTSILISRLNPRIERFWWVTPNDNFPALTSTEFAVISAASDLSLAGVWLAVRSQMFRSVLPMRVTGTSGSHQRVRPDDMLAIEVPNTQGLPDEQKATALLLLRCIERARKEIAQLQVVRNSLLPELLSGRFYVPTPQENVL